MNINQKANTETAERGCVEGKALEAGLQEPELVDLEICQSLGSNPFSDT